MIIIKTQRFIVRSLTLSDVTDRYLSWVQDKKSNPFIETADEKKDIESLKEYVSTRINRDKCIFLGIFLRNNNIHIGNIKFEPVDKKNGSATVGIMIGDQTWRGKGVAEEVITASADYLYTRFYINKIFLGVDNNNKSAIRAYYKSGFRYNGSNNGSTNESNLNMTRYHTPAIRLAIGTAQFGFPYGIANKDGEILPDMGSILLNLAWESGIDTLDTAKNYGSSEERLGKIGVENWRVITKMPPIPEKCTDISEWVFSEVNQSLSRLRINQLYGLLLHKPDQLMDDYGDELYKAIEELKKINLIKKSGISIYSPDELDNIWPRFQFDIVQSPFNMFDRRLKDTGWLNRLYRQGVEVHARSVFLQGLLLMQAKERPKKFLKWSRTWNEWDEWLKDNNLTPVQACLNYVMSHPEFRRVVIGIDNREQLLEIINSVDYKIPLAPEFREEDKTDLINPSLWHQL